MALSDTEVADLALTEDITALPKSLGEQVRANVVAGMRRKHAARKFPTPFSLVSQIEPGTLNPPHLQLIDEYLIRVQRREIRRLLITMPPQEGKTERCARAAPLWFHVQNPDERIVTASYELELARGSSQWIRDAIESHGAAAPAKGNSDLLGLKVRPDYRAASRWRLDGYGGGMLAVGTKGGLTGRPADVLIIDDPIKGVQEADSETNRETVWDWWTGTARTRLGPNAVVIMVMTPWHEDDIRGRLLAQDQARPPELREWVVLNLPAIAEPADPQKGILPDALNREPGECLPSTRGRDLAEYRRIELDVGPRVFNALYQGHPSPPEGGAFKWAWIRGFRVALAPPLVKVCVAVDPAGGAMRDETGIIVAGRDQAGRMAVIADRSGLFGAGEQWRRAWLAVLDHEADTLVYEKNLVDPMMRKGIRVAWRNLRREARALAAVQETNGGTTDTTTIIGLAVEAMLTSPVVQSDDDAMMDDDTPEDADYVTTDARALLIARLSETWLYMERINAAPAAGPAAVIGVSATRGKKTRAEPAAQAYSAGRAVHVGTFPKLESELASWQEGQDSPNRMDALVWAFWYLSGGEGVRVSIPEGQLPTGTQAAIPRTAPTLPTGAAALTQGR